LIFTLTGGTYNNPTGTATYTNNFGGIFNVSGFYTGATDVFITGATTNNSNKSYTSQIIPEHLVYLH
jgi:hypothetical protein